jgi:type II secretory pathway component PulF
MSFTYRYRARTLGGQAVRGVMRAGDRKAAFANLRERMLVPFDLESAPTTRLGSFFSGSRIRERLAFFRAYATLEHAGVDFSTSFDLLVAQARSKRFREALEAVRSDVEGGGERLWAAMARRPEDFSDLEVAMVAAGEEAGDREAVFDRLASFLERDARLRKRLAAVLLYPAIVLSGAGAVLLYLVFGAVPQFIRLFEAFDVAPSPLLAWLARAGDLLRQPAFAGASLLGFAIAAFLLSRFVATPGGALALDRLRLRAPFFGTLIKRISVARLARVLATLLQSGVNQLRALDVAIPVVESPLMASALRQARDGIAGGASSSLEEAFAGAGVFEPLLLGFIRVGTHAGDVPHMLLRVADYYEDDAESMLDLLPQAIQSAVTLGLGVLVAAIVYIVYVPLSTLATSIH